MGTYFTAVGVPTKKPSAKTFSLIRWSKQACVFTGVVAVVCRYELQLAPVYSALFVDEVEVSLRACHRLHAEKVRGTFERGAGTDQDLVFSYRRV